MGWGGWFLFVVSFGFYLVLFFFGVVGCVFGGDCCFWLFGGIVFLDFLGVVLSLVKLLVGVVVWWCVVYVLGCMSFLLAV